MYKDGIGKQIDTKGETADTLRLHLSPMMISPCNKMFSDVPGSYPKPDARRRGSRHIQRN
jgi:hypothetical protein